jgi:hypothetical protein
MTTVYVLQHCHVMPNGDDDSKLIGIYSSRAAAEAAVLRLRVQPGFCERPNVVNTEVDQDANGFYIDEYRMDEDHWREGYVTV